MRGHCCHRDSPSKREVIASLQVSSTILHLTRRSYEDTASGNAPGVRSHLHNLLRHLISLHLLLAVLQFYQSSRYVVSYNSALQHHP
ncbi:hypothetical protein T4D_3879 [Trichinella pseudospiralis]|uniref:Uncharacterized protein n=1 Tax=Trichinella pseudospiralis TaxID=6337 RepID=A0A0V1F578_TRIPS|nr:hypothetical protein T4D_3879 [Trichinella pseudospiralis]